MSYHAKYVREVNVRQWKDVKVF